MTGEWRVTTLDQLGRIVTGKTPPSSIAEYMGGDIPFVTPTDFDERRMIDSTGRYLTEQGACAVNSSRIPRGAVMVSCIGSDMGKAAISARACVTNQQINSIIIDSDDDPLFVYYNLSTRKAEIRTAAGGSAQPILNKSAFGRLGILLPPQAEQRAISYILGTIDDKIELNRRRNDTLEAIARALFKSWFIDFDPVHAKAEGRNIDLPKHVADLFPDSFEVSELGDIPKGWRAGFFGDFISSRSERVGSHEAIVLSAVANGRLVRSDDHFTKRVYSKEVEKYLIVEQWDFAYNPSRINIGSIGMLEEPITGAVSPVYVVVRPDPAYRWFLEFSLRRNYTKEWINSLASGSVRQSLSFTDFSSLPCVVPQKRLAVEFEKLWTPLREGIRSHWAESNTLCALRDTLLLKLISGDLLIHKPEQFFRDHT
jgi:type I restriction enzyme S subunit